MKKIFLNNGFILGLIVINALIIFTMGFELTETSRMVINIIDNIITVMFVIELIVKIKTYRLRGFFSDGWNIFDFILIVLSIPTLLVFTLHLNIADLSFILVFRIFRIFKSFRFLKFIPGITELINGIQRALKSSVFVLLGFTVYIFIIGVLSFHLFNSSDTVYFTDPFTSLYSIFKIFTVEGWYSVPEEIIASGSALPAFFIRGYFIFILVTGGILGLSLVNSIFVDAMVSDNNDSLEAKVDELTKKMDLLLKQK